MSGTDVRGTDVTVKIRPLGPDLLEAARAFFARVPEGDRTFFKEDVLDPLAIEAWAHDTKDRRLVAVDDAGAVVGYVAVIRGVAWSSHVGEVRVVVDPAQRRAGVGRALARCGLMEGLAMDLHKLTVEVVVEQTAAIAMFEDIGFEREALLIDQVQDRNGELHDLLVLAHAVDETWELMAAVGLDDALI